MPGRCLWFPIPSYSAPHPCTPLAPGQKGWERRRAQQRTAGGRGRVGARPDEGAAVTTTGPEARLPVDRPGNQMREALPAVTPILQMGKLRL